MLLMDVKGEGVSTFLASYFCEELPPLFLWASVLSPFPHFPLGGWVSQCDVSLGEAPCGLCSLTGLAVCTRGHCTLLSTMWAIPIPTKGIPAVLSARLNPLWKVQKILNVHLATQYSLMQLCYIKIIILVSFSLWLLSSFAIGSNLRRGKKECYLLIP